MPRTVRARTPIALVAIVLALGACTAETTEADQPVPSPSDSSSTSAPTSSPTVPAPTSTAPPTTSPTPEPDPAPTPTSLARVAAKGEAEVVALTGSRVVVSTARAVTAYDLKGRQVWTLKRAGEVVDDVYGTSATDDVVVVSWENQRQERFYPPAFVRVLDVSTGEELWRDDTASYARAGGGTVFTALCTGEQDRRLGDCTLSARDPRTGATRWSVPTYASTRVPLVRDDVLVTQSYPGQTSASYRVRDLATGAGVSAEVRGAALTSTLDGFTSATYERPGTDGCSTTVRHLDLAGEKVWSRRYPVRRDVNDPDECAYTTVSETPTDGPVPSVAYGSRSRVLDPGTGRTLLDLDNRHTLQLVADGVAVVADGPSTYPGAGSGVSLRTGRTLWSDPEMDPLDYETWVLAGTHALRATEIDLEDCTTEDVDLRTGKVLHAYPGTLAGSGPGWIAMASSCDGFGKNNDLSVYRLRDAEAVARY